MAMHYMEGAVSGSRGAPRCRQERRSNQKRWHKKGIAVAAMFCVLTGGGASLATAQEFPIMRNSTVLNGSALSSVSGVSSTNMAAGDGNLQNNSGVIAVGKMSRGENVLLQQSRIEEQLANTQESVRIQDRAFRQSEGWLSINQAAGQGNVQSNDFGVALGISANSLSDTTLQQVMADKQGLNGTGDGSGQPSRKVEIDKTTFEGARGVIQVNQSAGTGNATRNSFRMNMALGQ